MVKLFDENEFDKIEEEDIKEVDINDLLNTKISYKSKVMDIESILNALKRGDYKLPKYQRKYVWEKQQAANLILSLIKNIPIPPLYLYYDKDGKYVVLDGQQRITTLFMYYNNVFYTNSKVERIRLDFSDISRRLEDIEYLNERIERYQDTMSKSEIKQMENRIKLLYKEIKNKYNISPSKFNLNLDKYEKDITFSNFDEKAKRILRRKDLEVVFVECNGENSDKAYSDIFKLLNSSGKELSSQEIRNGVYYNNVLYDYIYEFNKRNTTWRKIYGLESSICKDMEYLLRFLALDYYSSYDLKSDDFDIKFDGTFSYSNIIDSYSQKFSRYSNSDDENKVIIEEVENDINKLANFFNIFVDIDENTKVQGKNLLVIEAMFLAFSKLGLLDKKIQISYFEWVDKIRNDKEVQEYSIQSTSSKGNVKDRIKSVIKLVKECLYNEN